MKNIEKCLHYEGAMNQRASEIWRGKGTEGTHGYEKMGCYGDCRGLNKNCKSYYDGNQKTHMVLDVTIEEESE